MIVERTVSGQIKDAFLIHVLIFAGSFFLPFTSRGRGFLEITFN